MIDLFRAVSEQEAADIETSGVLRPEAHGRSMEEKLLWTSEGDVIWFVEQARARMEAEFSHICIVRASPGASALQYEHRVDGRTVVAIALENQAAWSQAVTLELRPIRELRLRP